MQVSKDEARMLVADLGYEEAARRTGIKSGTLRQWAARFAWNKIRLHAQASTVTAVTKPAQAQAEALAESISRSRVALAGIVERSTRDVKRVRVTNAKELRDVTATAQALGPQWEARDARAGIQVNILSGNFPDGPSTRVIDTQEHA